MACGRYSRWMVFAAVVLIAPAFCPAQFHFRIRRDQAPLPIDKAAVNSVIDQALKLLDEEYVFPDLAAKMNQAIRKRQAEGSYAGITTGQELAQQLTKDLRAVSNDKHLRVDCSTEPLPKPPAGGEPSEPTPQMKEEMRQMFRWQNGGYREVKRLSGNVGYLALDGFADDAGAAEPAAAAMNFLAGTDALIIDLRHNGGGDPHGVALLCSYFFDGKPVHLNSLYSRKENKTEDFWTFKEVAGKRYLGKDVYVLTGPRTFSGGEEFAYDLQTQKRAVTVGETTGGGAHPGAMMPLGEHFLMFVPTGRAINPITKTDWEGTGVKPDVPVAVDGALEKAHELAIEKLLKNAPDDETRERIRMDVDHDRMTRKPVKSAPK
jgi:hypothetical protein